MGDVPFKFQMTFDRGQTLKTMVLRSFVTHTGHGLGYGHFDAYAATRSGCCPNPKQRRNGLLPDGWAETTDYITGKKYYYNIDTNQTQWERPACSLCVNCPNVFKPTWKEFDDQRSGVPPKTLTDWQVRAKLENVYTMIWEVERLDLLDATSESAEGSCSNSTSKECTKPTTKAKWEQHKPKSGKPGCTGTWKPSLMFTPLD